MRFTNVRIVPTWGVEMGVGLERETKWAKERRRGSVPKRGT